MIVYKKFQKHDGVLSSWSSPVGCDFYYSTEKPNVPAIPGSQFFVFKTLKEALEWDGSLRYPPFEIWECETPKVCSMTCRVTTGRGRDEVRRFWRGERGHFTCDCLLTTCPSLKLIRPVKIAKAYKAVRRGKIFFKSLNEREVLTYSLGEWVVPKIPDSKIFVFDSFENAKKFANIFCLVEIFHCEVCNPSKIKTIYPEISGTMMGEFWKSRKAKRRMFTAFPPIYFQEAPQGTLIGDAVRLM